MSQETLPTPLIYAVTLNWNRPEDTIACLRSLAQQDYRNLHVLVVDNGSSDNSIVQIQIAHPDAFILANPKNSGFARGTNLGIKYAVERGADFVFILNNDTELASDAISTLLHYYEDGVGLLAPIIYYADAPRRVWSLGGMLRKHLLEARGNLRGQEDTGQWPTVLERDFVPACGLLIPRLVFERVGYFDEQFFMYYEDLDFSLRVRQADLCNLAITTAKMWHKVSLSSGGSDSPNERYWMARSSVLYFAKHARVSQRPLIIFWRFGSAIRTSLRLLRRGKWSSFKAYWRGLWDGIRKRPL